MSTAPIPNAISFVPIAPMAPNMKNQKTITLMCGNKTFTLTGGTFQPGTQYVLTKLKGKPTMMVADQKKLVTMNEPDKVKVESNVSNINQSSTSPSTSQQPPVIKSSSKKVKKDYVSFGPFVFYMVQNNLLHIVL